MRPQNQTHALFVLVLGLVLCAFARPARAQCGASYDPGTNIGPMEGYVGRFDGLASEFANAPSGVWFNGPFTVSAWVRMRAFNYWERVLDFGNGAPSDNVMLSTTYETTGQPVFAVFQGGNSYSVVAPNPIPLNRWVHLAGTYSNNTLTLYINFQPVGTATCPGGPVNVNRSHNYIGHSNWGGDGSFSGDIAWVKIFSRALGASELQSNAFAPAGSGQGLVADWRWDNAGYCGPAFCLPNYGVGGSASWLDVANFPRTYVTQDTYMRGVADACRVPVLLATAATPTAAAAGASVLVSTNFVQPGPTGAPLTPNNQRVRFYLNGTNVQTISGLGVGSASTYVGPIQPGDNQIYARLENVTNPSIYVQSDPITVVGGAPQAIVTQPASTTVCAGSDAAFYVGATGDSLTYQWYRNNAPISGATGSTLVVQNVTPQNTGTYTVHVGSPAIVSVPAMLSVNSSASASDCSAVSGMLAPLVATEVVRSEYCRIDSSGASPNRKPRIAAVAAGIGAIAAMNPRATQAQISAFVTAYDAALSSAFADDPDLRRPVDVLGAVRSLSRVAPPASDPSSPLRGLNTDIGDRVLQALGASVQVSTVDASDARRDNMVNLQSSNSLDFGLSTAFAQVLTRGFRGQADDGVYNPLVEPALTAYLRTQSIEPYPPSLAGYPEVERAISMVPHTPGELAAAIAAGFQTQKALAVTELDNIGQAIAGNINSMHATDQSQGLLSSAISNANAQSQNIAAQIIAQRQLEASQQAGARAAVGMLSSLMLQGSGDDQTFSGQLTQTWESAGRVLRGSSQVAQAVVGAGVVGYQLFNWSTERFSWSSMGSGLGMAATGAAALVTMFAPEPVASIVQSIFDPIGGLRADIAQLRMEMEQRFDRVNAELGTVLSAVNNGFASVELGQRLTLDDIRGIQFEMFSLESNLDQLEGQLYGMLSAGFEQSFTGDMNVALGFRDATGADLPYNTPAGSFFSYGTEFRTWADQFSQNALYGGSSSTLHNDANAANVLGTVGADQQVPGGPAVGTPNPLGAALNNLRAFRSSFVSGAAPLAPTAVSNPNTWSFAAEAFERLGHENPWYFAKVYGDQTDANALISTGTASQNVEQAIRTYTLPGSTTSIFDRLISDARSRAASFDVAIAGSTQRFLLPLNLNLWNIWGPVNQQPSGGTYPPLTLESSGETFGFSPPSSTAVSLPPNLASRVPQEVLNAIYLHQVFPTAQSAPAGAPYLRVTGWTSATYTGSENAGLFTEYFFNLQVLIDVRFRPPTGAANEFVVYREVYQAGTVQINNSTLPSQQAVLDSWNSNQGNYTLIDQYSPQLGQLQDVLASAQASLQAEYLGDLIAQLSASGTSVATSAQYLESSRALLDAYLSTGLPETFEASDEMRSIIRGSEIGIGNLALVTFLQNQIDAIGNGIPLTSPPLMNGLWNNRLDMLAAAIAPTKSATYPAETHPMTAYTLACLRGLRDNARRLLNDDQYIVAPGQTLNVSWPTGVLANDANQGLDLELRRRPQVVAGSLPAGHSFTFTTETRTLANNTTRTDTFGGFTYTPPAGFTGDVVLQYTASVDLSDNSTPNIVTADPANIRIRVVACAPTITGQPSSVAYVQGGYASFTVAATAAVDPTYQWRRNGQPLADGVAADGAIVIGSTSPTLRILNAQPSANGSYDCAVTSECGTIVSSAASLGSACAADFDHSGALAVQDIFAFLTAWFALDPSADFNHSGAVTPQDIFDYLTAWFVGCH